MNACAVGPEPYQIMGYCDLREGQPTEATAAFKKAIEQEPRSWEYRYGLALARADAGLDPNPALQAARARDPREPLVKDAIKAFRKAPRERWPSVSADLRAAAIDSGRLTIR